MFFLSSSYMRLEYHLDKHICTIFSSHQRCHTYNLSTDDIEYEYQFTKI